MIDIYSTEAEDYVRVALAIETLAYHNKDLLSYRLRDDAKISEQIQGLLTEAINIMEKNKTRMNVAGHAVIFAK